MTGYVVHYNDGDTDRTESVPFSTCFVILNLNLTITYNVTVEAKCEHICGVSENVSITMTTDYQPSATLNAGDMDTCDIYSTTENYNISSTVQSTHSTTFNPTEKTSNDVDIALILGVLSVLCVTAIFILIIIVCVIVFAR